MSTQRVLVTGGSGFIAGHCILQLLDAGYQVRTTIRSLAREAAVRAVLAAEGMVDDSNLSFVAADLTRDAGWAEAAAGADFVIHAASPVQPGHVDDEDELIVPAREGTLRVLRAAHDAGVRRVVVTSAFHAVSWGHPHSDHVFTESDWTELDGPGVDAYGKSKTIAERAAWDYIQKSPAATELVTLLPVAVMGPVLGENLSGSNQIIRRMLDGDMPGFPKLFIPIVDVRDVAAAHLLAMTTSAAAGQRFLLSNGAAIEMKDIGATIRRHLGAAAPRVPHRTLPSIAVRLAALFSNELRSYTPDLGYSKKTSNEKARRLLGWTARPAEEAIASAAESILARGLVKP